MGDVTVVLFAVLTLAGFVLAVVGAVRRVRILRAVGGALLIGLAGAWIIGPAGAALGVFALVILVVGRRR